jgi:hypothetical protein
MPKGTDTVQTRAKDDGKPLAVPDLAIAAQILARPLPTVERAAQEVEPYRHGDGRPCWSIRELAKALSLPVEPVTRSQTRKRAAS